MEVDVILKKRGGKQNWIRLGGFSNGKVVFAWLTGVITLYVRLTTIDVSRLGLELISK